MTVHLTDAMIPTLEAKGGKPETYYFDTEVRGLSIRARRQVVMPQRCRRKPTLSLYAPPASFDAVAWGLQWLTPIGVRRVTLGYWPEVTTDKARAAATIIKSMGRDKHPRQHVKSILEMTAYAGKLVEEDRCTSP